MNNFLLEINNITKTYESVKALDNVSLNIPENNIFGLLGTNGAGKTTLIRIITNILVQDTGTIKMKHINNNLQRHLKIGYMPEERGLYKKMKVAEQLLYLAQLKNISKNTAKQRINEWLQKLGLSEWGNRNIEDLSKGMQQKVQFIATVLHNPTLIILDEPFSGLDPINSNLIKNEMFALTNQGATILFSTHRMEQVEEICSNIALINKGKLIIDGNTIKLRHQFKQNLFSICYTGEFNPTATHFDGFKVVEEKNGEVILQIEATYTAQQALSTLLNNGLCVTAFNEILPTINDIFIELVGNANN